MPNFVGFFKKAMPWLTTGLSLAGPPGIAAATVLGKVLNVDKPTPDNITKVLQGLTLTPELQAQLQQAERDYMIQMQKMGFEHEEQMVQALAADRDSARNMQISVRSWVPATLAVFVTGGFFGLLGLLMFHQVPPESSQVVLLMLGSLGTAWVTIIGFYFGSSSGSDQKTQVIADMVNSSSKK